MSVTKTFIITFVLVCIYLAFNHFWALLIFYILLNIFYVYFNFIKLNHLRESLITNTETFLSPCDGKVLDIKEEGSFKKFKIKMSIINRWALFLPQSSTLELLSQNHGKKYWRLKKTWPDEDRQSTTLALANRADEVYFIKLYPSLLGFSPLLYLKTGDRGNLGANFGRFYFGGTIIVELPNTVNNVVSIGDKLKAGETIIANIKSKDILE